MNVVVLLSGGIDSTVALAHTIRSDDNSAMAVSFDYGQTHRRELQAAEKIAEHYDVFHKIIDIRSSIPRTSALTGSSDIPETHATVVDATCVPGRNLVMLSISIAHAASVNAQAVVIGANADDRAGYPDCRPDFINSIDKTSRICTEGAVGVWAPLLRMTKTEIVKTGIDLDAPLHLTYSCYRGTTEPCDRCGACQSRNEAIREIQRTAAAK